MVNEENVYYRVTYNKEGIYNALRKSISFEEWKKILQNEHVSWLPKPPSYSTLNVSYFTEKGYERFNEKVLPIISKYYK